MNDQNTRAFAIIPAAGSSRRMGAPKLLLPWKGATLIEHVVGVWRQSRVNEVVVVVSPENEPLAAVCRRLPCRLIVPETPPADMKASVCHGLTFVAGELAPRDHDAWLVAPADLPALRFATIDAVLAAYDPANPTVLVPCHQGRRGHPVLFPWQSAGIVASLSPSESLKDLMSRMPVREIEVPDPQDFEDIDTPLDFERLQNRHIR
jgi:molybdenum cofactor cytidylyltransferase